MFSGLTSARGSIMDRATSGFPLSMGTSLAFESLFPPRQPTIDPERKFEPISIANYDQMWINVATLLRNAFNASEKTALEKVNPRHAVMVIENEMEIIRSLLQQEGGGTCLPQFYACTYDRLTNGSYGRAVVHRPANTAHAQQFEAVLRLVVKELKRNHRDFYVRDDSLDPDIKCRGLVLTHGTIELIKRRQFVNLDLLESHTGKLKPHTEWNSKYYPVPQFDMSMLPWQRMLVLALGDRHYVKPMDIKIRRLIMEIAQTKRWTPHTTAEKIRNDINVGVKDPLLSKTLQNLVAE